MKIVFTCLLLGLMYIPAFADNNNPNDYDPAESRCVRANDETINRLISNLDYVDHALPNIPPEEQHYLEAEYNRALDTLNEEMLKNGKAPKGNKMFYKLSLRPLYDVWYLRRTIEPARLALERVLKRQPHPENGDADFITYKNNPEAEKLERASMAEFQVEGFVTQLDIYLDKIEYQQKPFSDDTYVRLLGNGGMADDLSAFINCKLAKIMGKQSFQ